MESCRSCHHLAVAVLCVLFIRIEGLVIDLRSKPTNQSSSFYASKDTPPIYQTADRAVDGDLDTLSHTVRRLAGTVVRAGLNPEYLQNSMIGSPVAYTQATRGARFNFIANPAVSARYVSVHLSGTCLNIAEVMVEDITVDEADTTITPDLTVVTTPALLGESGDDDAVIEAYKGPNDIAAAVSFGRQLRTGGSNDELPMGSMTMADPPTGCAATLSITLPEAGGIDRTGVFYSEATKHGMSTRIQTIILPKDGNDVHTRPVQRTQVASIGDSVMLKMLSVNPANVNYRWRLNGGGLIESWNNLLSVSIDDVTLADEGVYSCFPLGEEYRQFHGNMRLIVRGCPSETWGGPSCVNDCRRCYNGGVCDDKTGTCICAPGFSGENCGEVHGRHIFGQDASHSCSNSTDPHNEACLGRLFCLHDPYGCSCAAGYTGLDCMQECSGGMFGADCKQTCHCVLGRTCLKDTGDCGGDCEYPYFGINCQCSAEHAVLGLRVMSYAAHELRVTWQPDSCILGYTLQYELTNRGQCEQIVSPERVTVRDTPTGQTTLHRITGIESHSNYTVYIRPQYDGAQGPEVSASGTTMRRTNPTSVSEVTVINMDSVSVSLSWGQVFCADYYSVEYALINRGGCEAIGILNYSRHCMCPGNEPNVLIPGLIPNSMYSVQVKAYVDGNYGPLATTVFTTSSSEPSEAPVDVRVTSITKRILSFTWSQPPCGGRGGIITGYVYVLNTLGLEPITVVNNTVGLYEKAAIEGLVPFTHYSFAVAARTSVGTGPYSDGVDAQTLEAEPTVPLNVYYQNVDDVSIVLVWSEPDPPQGIITYYNVQYWRSGESGTVEIDANVTQLMHRLVGLETNNTYSLQVQAATSVGVGPWSAAINATTIIGVPGAVGYLRWTERTENSVILDWNTPLQPRGQVMSYNVKYRIVDRPYQAGFTAMAEYESDEIERPPFVKINLDPGTKYEFRVSAKNQMFTGSEEVLEVYTTPRTDPPAPSQPKEYQDETTDTTVTIDLSAIALISDDTFINSYVVHVKKTSTSSVEKREAFNSLHYNTSGNEYIAAELLKQTKQEKFVVGDSKMYGSYWNAPLQTGAGYEIRIGSVSKGNATEAFVTYSTPLRVTVMQVRTQPQSPSYSGVVAAVVVLIAVAVGLVIITVVYKRRRLNQAKQSPDVDGKLHSPDILLEHKGEVQETPSSIYINHGAVSMNCEPSSLRKPNPVPKPWQNPVETQPASDAVKPETFTRPPPVRLEDLMEYIQMKESTGENGFKADYKTLPDGQLHPWTVAKKAENKQKNRYANVVAYDHSRVVLEPLEDDRHSDYFNACYIDGYNKENKYIASQGPNKASLRDIWRMVWQENVDKIIMLTNPVENGKYWADAATSTYSDIVVTIDSEEAFLDYTIRHFSIHQVGSEDNGRLVKQFHYTTWPDMKPPEYPAPLLNFMRVVNADHNHGRTVVHCSAGVGRTGTYIALDAMLEQMKQEGQVDVLGFVYQMRQKRIKMVQTPDQYKFIFDALLAASLTGDTTYSATNFRPKLTALKRMENGATETGMTRQFETLSKLSVSRGSDKKKAGQLPENVDKNRFPDFIPSDRARPYLTTIVHEDDTNYINANVLPGYRNKNSYIGTQMPLPNTVADFWRMVYDHRATCIVMLNTFDAAGDKTVCRYWPDEGSIEFGPLVVELSETTEYRGVTSRTFTLTNQKNKSDDARTVTQFQYHDWPSDEEVPGSLQGMLNLMEITQTWQEDTGPIVVQCIDGLGRTAVYCTLMALLGQFKVEKAVDVFQAVHRLRTVNHNMMYSVDQYALCYDVFQRYLDSTSIYENYTASVEAE